MAWAVATWRGGKMRPPPLHKGAMLECQGGAGSRGGRMVNEHQLLRRALLRPLFDLLLRGHHFVCPTVLGHIFFSSLSDGGSKDHFMVADLGER